MILVLPVLNLFIKFQEGMLHHLFLFTSCKKTPSKYQKMSQNLIFFAFHNIGIVIVLNKTRHIAAAHTQGPY